MIGARSDLTQVHFNKSECLQGVYVSKSVHYPEGDIFVKIYFWSFLMIRTDNLNITGASNLLRCNAYSIAYTFSH